MCLARRDDISARKADKTKNINPYATELIFGLAGKFVCDEILSFGEGALRSHILLIDNHRFHIVA